ncbi:MAG: 30S ribosomal protein S16 [Rhabdochlamydiaceae bacterium]|nr:30S ribosomal protein S16 [Rhabdochlamydiaceae bacterium]
MALKIRLRQQGSKNRQTYRIVVADARTRRDGKYVEKLGFYLPHLTENACAMDADRVMYWLLQGAEMSDQVKSLTAQIAPAVLKQFQEHKKSLRMKKIAKKRASKKAE